MSSLALETSRLGRRYGARWALRDCSLRLPAGGVIDGAGPSGHRPARQSRRGGVRRSGQAAVPGFTVAEMLRFGARMNPRWDDAMPRQRLAGLGIPLEQRAGRLSGGQRAQVALALALGKQPQLLLLDEPVASLDPLTRRQFFQTLMEQVAASQMTVVLSSHLLDDLGRSCDYLVLLSASRVQLSGPTDGLMAGHKALTGPAERVQALQVQAQHTIVGVEATGRLARLLVRLSGPIHDPAWTVRDVTLEELVLAYMSHPDTTLPSRLKRKAIHR